jgi:hypothetical protein
MKERRFDSSRRKMIDEKRLRITAMKRDREIYHSYCLFLFPTSTYVVNPWIGVRAK